MPVMQLQARRGDQEQLMPQARDGDMATYQQCANPACPANRPGMEHAHLVSVEREDGELIAMHDRAYAAFGGDVDDLKSWRRNH
jgi:hypothetical protein